MDLITDQRIIFNETNIDYFSSYFDKLKDNYEKSKYIQYDGGTIPFKSLLVSSVSRSKKVSSTNLIREIERIIDASKSRISDQKITNILNKKGFNLARRTINKYRKKSKFS